MKKNNTSIPITRATIIGICSAFLLFSCAKPLVFPAIQNYKLEEAQLLRSLDSLRSLRPETFYGKYQVEMITKKQEVSFKTSVRSVTDSAMNLLVTFAAIPVANASITKDSVTVVNKRNSCYLQENMQFIKQSFGIDLGLSDLEELIEGIPLHYDSTRKYVQLAQGYNVLSTHDEAAMKELRNNPKESKRSDFIIQYVFSENGHNLIGLIIESPSDKTMASVRYTTFEQTSGYLIPKEILIDINTEKNKTSLTLVNEKMECNQPQDLYFVIPEGYEKCN